MRVNCAGCAGCCIDWRPVGPDALDHERHGSRRPLDDTYNLVPLSRDEVRRFVDDGFGDAMTPRLWTSDGRDETVDVDGHDVVALDGRPVFFVGLRKPPKPVGPFGIDRHWLKACVFLDPDTLQCRIHGSEQYPATCSDYPGQNLRLGRETECERVERAFGGDRLLDDTPPEHTRGLHLGMEAIGGTLFVHPDPDRLDGVVDRLVADELTPADRAAFVGVAVGSHPGTTEVDERRAAAATERALAADGWAGEVVDAWTELAGEIGSLAVDDSDTDADGSIDRLGDAVEVARGAPETKGWNATADGEDGNRGTRVESDSDDE